MADFKIKTCDKENYDSMLKFLAGAFAFEDPHWFSNNIPNCCPPINLAKEQDFSNHILTFLNNKIVGSIGVYPVTWVVSYKDVSVRLKMAGIGQVAAEAKHRGNGIMSGMLREAIKRMEEQQIDCSWLFGERARYYNYGWEYGGTNIRYKLSQKTLNRMLAEVTAAGKQPDNADIDKINTYYEKLPSYVNRDYNKWVCHLSREIYPSLFLENESGTGYLFSNSKNLKEIVEINGDVDCIKSLLKKHVELHGLNELEICYPAVNSELGSFLYKHASGFSADVLCQFRVTSGSVLEKLIPIILRQAEDFGIDIKKVRECLLSLDINEKKAVCERLFGYSYMPWDMEGLSFITPMCIWTSHLEDI